MISNFKTPLIPTSWGEFFDKITILEIKSIKITGNLALININKELSLLSGIVSSVLNIPHEIHSLKLELYKINTQLWAVEDDIREKDKLSEFDSKFIDLARSVYRLNDERAKIKKRINLIMNSEIKEEKSYKDFN